MEAPPLGNTVYGCRCPFLASQSRSGFPQSLQHRLPADGNFCQGRLCKPACHHHCWPPHSDHHAFSWGRRRASAGQVPARPALHAPRQPYLLHWHAGGLVVPTSLCITRNIAVAPCRQGHLCCWHTDELPAAGLAQPVLLAVGAVPACDCIACVATCTHGALVAGDPVHGGCGQSVEASAVATNVLLQQM